MRKLLRTYLFGWLRKTNSISRCLELRRMTLAILTHRTVPDDRLKLLREIKRLERGIKRIWRL